MGGGPGAYACWLASEGYEVRLIDPVPLHVEQAREASAAQPQRPLAGAEVGDARALDVPDAAHDVVLLLGPLYHQTQREDRVAALREARRVLHPGGKVLAAAISRFASLMDGLLQGFLDEPAFAAIVARDLREGQHRNPTGEPRYFTTAFFHHPDELRRELHDAGLRVEEVVAVEGPGWLLPDLGDRLANGERREQLLAALRAVEREPSLLGVSAHVMAVARRPKE